MMFKKVPGNTEYGIDIDGKVLDSAEKEIVLESVYSERWIVSAGLKEIDVGEYREKPKPYNGVMIKDWSSGLETAAKSVKQASVITGVTPRVITLRLADKGITRNFSFRPIGQECSIRIL